MNNTTVIIGAGISGLLLARELTARGAKVIVLEKSRGVGGRMSTKRVGNAVFDQGAQFFTVRDEYFEALVECWSGCGATARWGGAESDRWIACPSMTGLAKALAKSVNVRLSHKVAAVKRHRCGCWEIDVEGEELIRAERLVMSSPVPQSLAMLDVGAVTLPSATRSALEQCVYHPCLALMLILDRPSAVPPEGQEFADGPFRWVVDNVAKGVAQSAPAAITVHLSREFSGAHYSASEAEVFEKVIPALRPLLGEAVVTARALHRWRFSEPAHTHPQKCVWLSDMALGFCGDSFGGPRVEGAATSGLALAREIAKTLERH
ncbi:NAD(P)/FAD-dependent oxidoreductase [Synoicihabitans lomoniglobus]|uniref:FAD-dependent oxidoreductase n=1 Tax=Synoicihabitans lomoniglobus TaxID=2909285 RepID=A0AAF0I3X2_9BACT|nr:FAD-dependent oxidoreductase [Opitutaceae bacterium LMO-M01]WED67287.1 FAD-dependent oxidoreductase [Opitutaceae bacterium LMO-M01]